MVGDSARSLGSLPSGPVYVAYPAGFDFTFVYWYLIRFTGHSPFSHSALDIKTYAMARLKTAYSASTKRNMLKRWFDRLPHTHQALGEVLTIARLAEAQVVGDI